MTLDAFLEDNRAELITRTRAKVAARSSPPADSSELEHGVPLFLSQLSAALEAQGLGGTTSSTRASRAAQPGIGESAAKHGRDLLKFGFTIEQVVHDYGDVCQAVTELAQERGVSLSVAEFHTMNRCLDNAIAGAVSAWSDGRDRIQDARSGTSASTLTRDLGKLVDQARAACEVIRGGKVAIGGATGTLLLRALDAMRALLDEVEAK
jgi:hypothetical protein